MSAVSKSVKDVGKGVEKIGQGKVGEGLGDIGETYARTMLDTMTAGNKGKVDELTGGFMTSIEGMHRGNTKDIARVGLTAGAAYLGGGLAAFATNTALANGGDVLDGALAGAVGAGGTAGSVASIANKFLNQPQASLPVSQAQSVAQPQTIVIPSQPNSSLGIDNKTLMMIGGGLMGFLLLIVLIQKGK